MGPLRGVKGSGHCSVNFVWLDNKEFYIDEPVEEFEVKHLVGEDGVRKQRMNKAQELRVSEPVDGNFQCHDIATKRQIADERNNLRDFGRLTLQILL